MLRPLELDKTFDLAIDAYTCLWGGLLSPKLCLNELNEQIGDTDLLVSMESSFSDDTHLSKSNYFNICLSDERTRDICNISACMIAVFAFEYLKNHPRFNEIREMEVVNFLRHLRNAAAHGNKFCFTDSKSKKFRNPGIVSWRSKTIDKKLEGEVAFPNFFPAGDFAYLFEDITKILKESNTSHSIVNYEKI